jgi:GNAT superfamily N-acetyltransferase
MEKTVKDISSPNLIRAVEMNMCAWFENMSHSTARGEFMNGPDFIQYITAIPHPMFNGVICTRPILDEAEKIIDEALSRFKGLPMVWWTGPSAGTQNFKELLEPRGFSYLMDYPGMALDLNTVNRKPAGLAGLEIRFVDDPASMKIWSRILFNSFKFPDSIEKAFLDLAANRHPRASWRRYIALLKGEPVATSELFLGAGTAGIYYVATEPDFRRRGIGSAITLAPLLDALETGFRTAILKATKKGFNIYRQIGFEEYCRLGLYIRKEEDY